MVQCVVQTDIPSSLESGNEALQELPVCLDRGLLLLHFEERRERQKLVLWQCVSKRHFPVDAIQKPFSCKLREFIMPFVASRQQVIFTVQMRSQVERERHLLRANVVLVMPIMPPPFLPMPISYS